MGCQTAPTVSHLLFADDSFLFFQASTEESTNIKRLLRKYEECSGQSVNLQKSGIYFSTNVRRDKQLELSAILGVHNEITNTKYLGLPSLVGKSKKRVFSYLKDKASKRIQAWKAKPISQAGKTVLIRNVAQAILLIVCRVFCFLKRFVRSWNNFSTIIGGDLVVLIIREDLTGLRGIT